MAKNLQGPDFDGIAKGLLEDIVTYASVTGLNHIKECFDKGGFTDEAFEAWPKRKDGDETRALLVHTTNLRDSNVIQERSISQIVFTNAAPYASIHNYGGSITIRVTKKSRKFFWYMYKLTDKEKWKYMAMTKKDRIVITMPARPFMKESKALTNNINSWVAGEITTRFNNANRE